LTVDRVGLAALAALLAVAVPAAADEAPPELAAGTEEEADAKPAVEWHLDLNNLFIFRNDRDFDRTPPAYDENGQTVGAFATIFKPNLTWNITDELKVFYEIEVGLNYWSKNNPDEENALAADIFVLKHRQLYTEGSVADGHLGFKVGYQYFTDPTALFMGHWIGAANLWWQIDDDSRLTLFAGQVPDTTFEGMDIRFNNFSRDIWVFGGRADLVFPEAGLTLAVGLHDLYDRHVVDRTLWLVAPSVQLEWTGEGASASVGAMLQYGKHEGAAIDLGDATVLAWAAQAHAELDAGPVTLAFNALALSPDDSYDGNDREGGFHYSSKSTSATMLVTEDEVRNWYDQLDRRMGRYDGGFWQHRAGLFVGDVKATVDVLDWFRPAIILGASTVLNPDNALGNAWVGFEADLDLAFRYGDHLIARVVPGIFVPGRAAAAIVNEGTNREAADPVYSVEASLQVVY
jgi:hypothetical protein